jgi:hypothetical protein
MKINMWIIISLLYDDGRRLKQKARSIFMWPFCVQSRIIACTMDGSAIHFPSSLLLALASGDLASHFVSLQELFPALPPPTSPPDLTSVPTAPSLQAAIQHCTLLVTNISFLFGPFACSTGYLENNVWSIRQYSQCLGISF